VIWEEYPGLRGSDFEQAYRKAESEGVASSFTAYYPDHDRYYEVHVYPAVYGISIYFNDISDRKRQEIELNRLAAESEKQRRVYEAALSNTPDLVYVFGLDHRFVYANEALLLMWGRTREQAIGNNCLELGYEPWHAAMHDREIEQVVATKKPIRGEVPFTGTQGRRIYDYIFVPVIGSDDEVVAVAGTTRDVTERQQAEQAIREQSEQLRLNDRRKDEFLAMLAHELRNPLSAVGNAVTVLKMSDEAEHQDFAKEVIERQVRQLARLIDDLLDVSRITTGKIRLRRDLVDAGSILRQAVETVRPLMTERNHKLVVDLREQVLPLRADSTRIEQVVVNLLTNAAKYTPNGGEIRLTAWLEDDKILIEVKDNGIGISPEILPEMFHLFAQGERSIARSEGGLGIGLTIVEKLAELHGGSVDASSGGIGLGSTFTVRLPAANNPATPTKADDLSQSQRQSGSRILVVDDNTDTARGLARLLKLIGNEVRIANDGPSAIQVARELRPDFVLLDIGLPGMDGYQVASVLREDPCCRNALIIAISGYGQAEDRRRSLAAGFDHHLVKPVDFDSLVSLIGSAS
jgi:PAS domain S-box-containing protein